MTKQEFSVSEKEEGAVGGAKLKKSPEQTVASDPPPTFLNLPMTMEGVMQMMMAMRKDEERRRREEKKGQEEKEENGGVKRRRNKKRKRKRGGNKKKKREICVKQNWR